MIIEINLFIKNILYSFFDQNKSIILFDGICNLCEGFVKFAIQRDSNDHYLFSSLQSKTST